MYVLDSYYILIICIGRGLMYVIYNIVKDLYVKLFYDF